jgi:hypothetical protein
VLAAAAAAAVVVVVSCTPMHCDGIANEASGKLSSWWQEKAKAAVVRTSCLSL